MSYNLETYGRASKVKGSGWANQGKGLTRLACRAVKSPAAWSLMPVLAGSHTVLKNCFWVAATTEIASLKPLTILTF